MRRFVPLRVYALILPQRAHKRIVRVLIRKNCAASAAVSQVEQVGWKEMSATVDELLGMQGRCWSCIGTPRTRRRQQGIVGHSWVYETPQWERLFRVCARLIRIE